MPRRLESLTNQILVCCCWCCCRYFPESKLLNTSHLNCIHPSLCLQFSILCLQLFIAPTFTLKTVPFGIINYTNSLILGYRDLWHPGQETDLPQEAKGAGNGRCSRKGGATVSGSSQRPQDAPSSFISALALLFSF